jgi:hypothetical protein
MHKLKSEENMSVRGRKPLELRSGDKNIKLIKRNYYIEERYAKALTVLSALTGKELSLLVNEAISGLIKKYQPMTDIDLLKLKAIKKED